MRKVLVFATCLLFYSFSYSQKFSLSLLRQAHTAYLQFENPFSCTVERLSCNSISLSTDNGMISKISPCQYIYHPLKIADSKIIISKRVNNKLIKIGEYFIKVRSFPNPIAFIGNSYGDSIRKNVLRAQQGVAATAPPDLGFDLKYPVKQFTASAFRNGALLFSEPSYTNRFTDKIHEGYNTLIAGDVIVFSSIYVFLTEEKEKLIAPLQLVITD